MKKFLLLVSAPLALSVVLVVLKYAVFADLSLFWALSPLWMATIVTLLVFYAVWLNIAWQKWRLRHGRKICRNCLYCSLAEIKPGRNMCLESSPLKEVSPTQKGCEHFAKAITK